MPRMKDETGVLLSDLQARLQRLVEIARREGRESALSELRSVLGGGAAAPARRRGRPAAEPKAAAPRKRGKTRRNPWATMTEEQKADRVRKMLAGRGLKPKGER